VDVYGGDDVETVELQDSVAEADDEYNLPPPPSPEQDGVDQ